MIILPAEGGVWRKGELYTMIFTISIKSDLKKARIDHKVIISKYKGVSNNITMKLFPEIKVGQYPRSPNVHGHPVHGPLTGV